MEEQPERTEKTTNEPPLLLPMTTKTPFWAWKWTKIAIALVLIAPLATMLLWWGWSNSSFSKLSVDAVFVEGTAEYIPGYGGAAQYDTPWEKLHQGMSFGEGAQIRALKGGRVILNIDDGSIVRLNGNASITLTKLTAKHIVIQNTGGEVYTRVVQSTKRTFKVRSGSITYQALGAAYRTFTSDEKQGVEVYYGNVNIVGLNKSAAATVKQGERYYVVNADNTALASKVTQLSIAELSADAFIRWNSEQDKKYFASEIGVLFDVNPPALELSSPTNGLITDTETIDVTGTTETGARVLVNGVGITNNDGQFTTTVSINEGNNDITVEAIDSTGNKTVNRVTVTRTSDIPAI